MARDPYYDDGYETESRPKSPLTIFLIAMVILMLALIALCVLLNMKLRDTRTELTEMQAHITAVQNDAQSRITASEQAAAEAQAKMEAMAAATPEPAPAPTPTPTPEPVEEPVEPEPAETSVEATPEPTAAALVDGLPSWISESDLKNVSKRPKDDEWYAVPGKLYVQERPNLRSGPDSSYKLIATLSPDMEVTVYAAHDNWRFIKDANGHFGWISSKYLDTQPSTGPVATPTPSPEAVPEATPEPEAPQTNG